MVMEVIKKKHTKRSMTIIWMLYIHGKLMEDRAGFYILIQSNNSDLVASAGTSMITTMI